MQLHELTSLICTLLPPEVATPGDAIGLQVSSVRGTASQLLVALELTYAVLAEARATNTDVIVVFHPLIFTPLEAVGVVDRVERLVRELVLADIALISVHTTFDAHPLGTNYLLAKRLGLTPVGPLEPSHTPGFGMGLLAESPQPVLFDVFLAQLSAVCGSPVRFTPPKSQTVNSVAFVGGSGMHWFDAAVESQADVFVTADVRYHAFHAAQGVIGLVDPGHFEMEQFVPGGIADLLRAHVPNSNIRVSSVNTNPVRYQSPLPLAHSTHLTGSV